MQKRSLCAALCLVLFLVLGSPAVAAERGVKIMVDGVVLESNIATEVYAQNTYVSYWPVVKAICPDATAVWENDHALVQAENLTMRIYPNALYLEANGRYLYAPTKMRSKDQMILVPARILAQALGASAWWEPDTSTVVFQSGSGPLASGDTTYNSDDLYWLSRIICAEAGNQSLAGKIAVGDVVMNRVESGMFPNTIYGVIFQPNQFSPVANGTIERQPNAESVIAAKLVLEGASTAADSLYFVNPRLSPNSWAARNRTRVATIGAHAFFE